jgi:hypothetical protein
MRSHTLHAAVRAFAEEAAALLAGETAQGAEVPFELEETGPRGHRTPLYCYRPLVGEFVRQRAGALERLPSHSTAVATLADHADRLARYMSAIGERPSGAPAAALQAFLGRVFGEATDFALEDARFDRAYAQLEEALFTGRTDATVVVGVVGLDIASPEVVLGEGLSLQRAEALAGAPADATEADVLAVFRAVVDDDAPDPFV